MKKSWLPIKNSNLLRLGNKNDGGYIVSREIVNNAEILVSFGISNDWSFEEDLILKSRCNYIVCYDHSVSKKIFFKEAIRMLFSAIAYPKNLNYKINRIKNYFQYINFFNQKNIIHIEKKVSNNIVNELNNIDIQNVFKNFSSKKILLKIDIEGSEYRILNDICKIKDKLIGIIIEFHDIDLNINKIQDFIDSISEFKILHIHGNNCGEVDNEGNPTIIEMTLLNINLIKYNFEEFNNQKYPLNKIDFPNDPFKKDIKLEFND